MQVFYLFMHYYCRKLYFMHRVALFVSVPRKLLTYWLFPTFAMAPIQILPSSNPRKLLTYWLFPLLPSQPIHTGNFLYRPILLFIFQPIPPFRNCYRLSRSFAMAPIHNLPFSDSRKPLTYWLFPPLPSQPIHPGNFSSIGSSLNFPPPPYHPHTSCEYPSTAKYSNLSGDVV